MARCIFMLFGLAVLTAVLNSTPAAGSDERPRLVVLVVVDQLALSVSHSIGPRK